MLQNLLIEEKIRQTIAEAKQVNEQIKQILNSNIFVFVSDVYNIAGQELNMAVYNDELEKAIKWGFTPPNILKKDIWTEFDFSEFDISDTYRPEMIMNSNFLCFFAAYDDDFLQLYMDFDNKNIKKGDDKWETQDNKYKRFYEVTSQIEQKTIEKHKKEVEKQKNNLKVYSEYLNFLYNSIEKMTELYKKIKQNRKN